MQMTNSFLVSTREGSPWHEARRVISVKLRSCFTVTNIQGRIWLIWSPCPKRRKWKIIVLFVQIQSFAILHDLHLSYCTSSDLSPCTKQIAGNKMVASVLYLAYLGQEHITIASQISAWKPNSAIRSPPKKANTELKSEL